MRIFKISTYISIYLFHILVHIAFQSAVIRAKGLCLFCRMKELWAAQFGGRQYSTKCLWIKLGRSSIMTFTKSLFLISLAAYSHNLLLRLFVPLMEINPVFLLMSLPSSYLSIFAKVHTL